MPISMRTSAWCVFTLEFTCKWRRIIFRSSNKAYHRQYGSVFQKNAQFTGELNHFTILGTGPNITPRFGSIFDVQVSRKSNMSSTAMSQRMVWVDLEMTGLDIEKDQIIEMACIITDSDLNILAEGPNLIINQPDKLLEGMSEWCKEHHGKSGLTQAVRDSKITLEQAEYEFLSFLRQHTPPGQCPLAGNSVHADKRFLDKYMPQFMYHLHYRIIDVSTIKELCRHLFGPHVECSSKQLPDENVTEPIPDLQRIFIQTVVSRSIQDGASQEGNPQSLG
uniref:small fragment nuclease isoform X2 n=1 Tax=Scatophagus argus TaxID=75038 RepID=UPI001ED837C4|nr:small fragment nuclease isoform X2 [Scatophagus argus]